MKISGVFSPCRPLLVTLSWEMDVMSVLHNRCDWLIRLLAVQKFDKKYKYNIFSGLCVRLWGSTRPQLLSLFQNTSTLNANHPIYKRDIQRLSGSMSTTLTMLSPLSCFVTFFFFCYFYAVGLPGQSPPVGRGSCGACSERRTGSE